MSLRQRLTLGTLFLFALLLLSAGLGITQLGKLSRDAQVILQDNYETARYVQDMQKALLHDDRAAFDAALRKQEGNITEAGEQDLTAGIRRAFNAWPPDSTAERTIHAALQEILDLNLDAIERKNSAALATAERARHWLWGIAAVVLLVGLLFSIGFPRLITQPIWRLQHAVEEVAEGNYRHRVPTFRSDELGALSASFNAMAQKLEQWESSNLARVMTEKLRAEAVLNSLEDAGIGVGPDGRILFVNRKAAELLGTTAQEITGQRADELATRNDLLRHVLDMRGGAPFRAVLEGHDQFFAGVSFPIESPSGNLGTVYLMRNVTPFQEKDEAKNRFLATITHELKTPLASSDIGLGLLERSGTFSGQQRAILEDLRKDHQRLVRIVSELLDMAQIEAGRMRVRIGPRDLGAIVRSAIEAVRASADHKEIRIETEFPNPIPRVMADDEKATWALINLLSNAVRHGPPRSKVSITCSTPGDQVLLSIADQGPGIAVDQRDRLFERFAPHSRSGTGLGLAIAREFMQAMSGDIVLSHTNLNGSTFTMHLKAAEP